MNKWLLRSLYAAPVLLIGGLSWADYTATQGAGTTVFAFVCSVSKVCPASVLINSANTEIGTTANPIIIAGPGTAGTAAGGVQTVQGAAGMTPLVANAAIINGANTAAVKPASTAPVATDPALVVAISPNSAAAGGTSSNYGSAFPGAGTAIGLQGASSMLSWGAKAGNTYAATDVVPGVSVVNTNANGRATAANGSPVTPVAAASTAGAIVPNNTTAVVVKGSAGTLFGVQVYGINAAPAYLKIYNAATATCGSGTPVKRIMIPAASTAANGAGSNVTFGPGLALGTGITYCVTTGIADADTTAPTAANFLVNVDYE